METVLIASFSPCLNSWGNVILLLFTCSMLQWQIKAVSINGIKVTAKTDEERVMKRRNSGERAGREMWLSAWNYIYGMHEICSLYTNEDNLKMKIKSRINLLSLGLACSWRCWFNHGKRAGAFTKKDYNGVGLVVLCWSWKKWCCCDFSLNGPSAH